MPTMNAGAAPDANGVYVVLTVQGGTPPYTWTADPIEGDTYNVPPQVGDGSTAYDGAAPLGMEVAYTATDALGTQAATMAVRLPDDRGAVLSDAVDPTRWTRVAVVDQLPNEWQGRSVWFDVLDRADPLPAVAPMRLRNGDLILYTATGDQRALLLALLRPGTPLRLRTPCRDAVDDVLMLPANVREELHEESSKAGGRLWTITYQAVTSELGPYLSDPDWSWDAVVADPRNPSWDLVKASFLSWDALVSNIRKP